MLNTLHTNLDNLAFVLIPLQLPWVEWEIIFSVLGRGFPRIVREVALLASRVPLTIACLHCELSSWS